MTLKQFACPFTAFVVGWAVAIYATATLVVLAGVSPHVPPLDHWSSLPGRAFAVADWISPTAKLSIGATFALLLWPLRAVHGLPCRLAGASIAGLAATLAVLLVLPGDWSRGFGVGLTGVRLDPVALPLHLVGGALGGIAFALQSASCTRAAG